MKSRKHSSRLVIAPGPYKLLNGDLSVSGVIRMDQNPAVIPNNIEVSRFSENKKLQDEKADRKHHKSTDED